MQEKYINIKSLKVSSDLVQFVKDELLKETEISPENFWAGFEKTVNELAPKNRELISIRKDLQSKIDDWHIKNKGSEFNFEEYKKFLIEIGYLKNEGPDFQIETKDVDDEIAKIAGPQLVVPVMNARYALNAANARWMSLYDSLYGTDIIEQSEDSVSERYDPLRGEMVIKYGRDFLDKYFPLKDLSWKKITSFAVKDGKLKILKGADLVSLIDEDKFICYRNWLGLMRGDLKSKFEKDGKLYERKLNPNRSYISKEGKGLKLHGRSLLLVRNVGHLMTNPSIILDDGNEVPEGILDAFITTAAALHDLKKKNNSRTGSVYIVKPKMHGPDETAFTDLIFSKVEEVLGLKKYTCKIGIMDEERRTSSNLKECIRSLKNRVFFINTGFLDRTGDEMHTSMMAGPMIKKGEMKSSKWITAYENRNVDIGLKCGFSGKAQIGKGMWAMPDKMKDMMEQKTGHLKAGANCAWVPSPTAAALHALHYHEINIFDEQRKILNRNQAKLDDLLTIPVADRTNWSVEEINNEISNSAQTLLGYVVRWVDQGIGCSKVPDINNVGLMEDRATLRISSQHIANWIHHGITTEIQVTEIMKEMAKIVDDQNKNDSKYIKMSDDFENSIAFKTACDLVFKGKQQPSGYTEPLLHINRLEKKSNLN
ncbi:malate synthase G [Pelagibacterales bacterium SAG-MED14]|nr:malate synthase G [Pelagibacterales bacterium SAG-MED14]